MSWATWCKQTAKCTFHHDGNPLTSFDNLMSSVKATPLAVGDRRVTWGTAINGSASALYSTSQWIDLATALTAAEKGNGTGLLALSDQLAERRPDGTYTNAIEALNAIDCLDTPGPTDVASFEKMEKEFRAKYPHIGYALAWGTYICAVWPVPPTGVPDVLTAAGAPPIVVVATTNDPATPYESGVALAKGLKSGVLLTYEGDGHTAYHGGQNTCIDDQVDAYLLNLTVPTTLTCK